VLMTRSVVADFGSAMVYELPDIHHRNALGSRDFARVRRVTLWPSTASVVLAELRDYPSSPCRLNRAPSATIERGRRTAGVQLRQISSSTNSRHGACDGRCGLRRGQRALGVSTAGGRWGAGLRPAAGDRVWCFACGLIALRERDPPRRLPASWRCLRRPMCRGLIMSLSKHLPASCYVGIARQRCQSRGGSCSCLSARVYGPRTRRRPGSLSQNGPPAYRRRRIGPTDGRPRFSPTASTV